mgnify:CR=1 FL=1
MVEEANIVSENVKDRVVDPQQKEETEETKVENKLRTETLEHFVGQENIKKHLFSCLIDWKDSQNPIIINDLYYFYNV